MTTQPFPGVLGAPSARNTMSDDEYRKACKAVMLPYEMSVEQLRQTFNRDAVSGDAMERVLKDELGAAYQPPFDQG